MATTVYELMAKLGLDTSEYEKGLDKAKSSGSSLGKGLASAAKVGMAAVSAATTAVVGFGATSVKAGADFDKSMSQVAATMGKTMDEMANEVGTVDLAWGTFSGNLREYAQEMGRNTAFSATQAADALNYMALAGYDTQTSMEMLPNVLNLAAAGAMDLARASDMVTDTQTAFGISLDRTSQMVDEMAKAASTGNTSVEQLGDAFLTVGGLAQELNGGFIALADGTDVEVDGVQELEIALTAMANAGIKGSEAGTHMRNMLLKLSSPTSDGTKQLEKLGITVFDTEGNMRSLANIFGNLSYKLGELTQEQKLQAISDLFNTRDTAAAEALLEAVGQDWDEIGESILNADGAAQKMAETQMDNLAGDVTYFKSALEGAQIAISDSLSPELRDFVKFGTDGISQLTNAFKEGGLSGAMEMFGKVLADGLNMIIEKLPSFIQAGMDLLGALGQGLLDNLPMIIDTATQVVEMLLQGIITALPKLVEGALQIVESLANWVGDQLPTLIPAIVQLVVEIVNTIIEHVPLLIGAAVHIVEGLVDGILQALPILIDELPGIIDNVVQALISSLPMLINGVIHLVMGIVDALPEIVQAIVNALPSLITSIIDSIVKTLPQLVNGVMQLILGLVNALPQIISLIVNALPQITVAVVTALLDSLPTLIDGVMQLVMEIVSALPQITLALVDAIPQIITMITEQFPDMLSTLVISLIDAMIESLPVLIEGLIMLIAEIVMQLPTIISGLINAVPDIMTAVVAALGNVGETLVTPLVDGLAYINSWWQSNVVAPVGGKITELLNIAAEYFAPIIEIFQPVLEALQILFSTVWQAIGVIISNGITAIKDSIVTQWEFIKSVISAALEAIRGIVELAWTTLNELTGGKLGEMVTTITSKTDQARTQFKQKMDTLKENARTAITNMINVVQQLMENLKSKFIKWGSDMIANFINGIRSKMDNLSSLIKEIASLIASILGFSEPDIGPLSNFHTFAPDMMDLFMQGVKDKAGELRGTIEDTFDIGGIIKDASSSFGDISTNRSSDDQIVSLLQEIRDNGTVVVSLEGDADRLFRVMQSKANSNYRLTGNSGMVTV